MILKKTLFTSTISAFICITSASYSQMMGGGKNAGMMCPGMQGYGGMMHDGDINLEIKELKDGVTFTWTSKNPDKVKSLKEMAQHMKTMHEQAQKTQPPK